MQQHQKKTSSMESVHSLMLTNNNGRVGRSGSDGLLPRYSTEHNNAAMLLSSSPSSPTNTTTTTNYNNNNNNGNHSSSSSSGGSRFARLLAPLLSNNKSKNQQQQQQQQQSATLSPTTTTTPLSLSTSPPQSHHAAQLKHMDSFDMTLMNRSMFYQQSLHNNNNNNGSNSNSTTGNNHANNHPSSSLQLQVNHPNTNTNHNVKRSSMVYTYPSTLLSPSSATPTTPVATLNTLTSPTSPTTPTTTATNTAVNHRNSLNHSQIVISQQQNHHHHHHHHLPSKSVSMDKPISNIEEEFDTRVRITCHICRNLLNKRGKLYVKLIDWKSYVLMNVSLDEMGGVMIRTVSESGVLSDETIVSHCKMLPTQHFSVNHRGRLPIQVSKEPLVKSAMTAKDRRKDHGTMNKVDKERVVCNVFSFILENHETNVSEQQEEREESENSSFLQSILFACADDAELEDWNQLFDLITMRNMALFNISSRINRKDCNLLYRPRECLRQQIMDEMNLVVNSGMEDVVGLDQLLSLYTEEINV